MRTFTVEEPIFKTATLFVLGASQLDFGFYMRRRYPRVSFTPIPEKDIVGTVMTFTGPPWRLVWTERVDLPEVLHEVFHLVTRICADKGIPIKAHHSDGMNGDETAAYLFEYFTRAVLKRVKA